MRVSTAALFVALLLGSVPAVAGYMDYPLYAITLGPNFEPPPAPPTTVPLGGATATGHGVEYGFGYLWANRMTPPALVRVNPATGELFEIALGTAPGNEPRAVSVGPSFVAVADFAAGEVKIIDPAALPPAVVATITNVPGVYGSAWDAAGNFYPVYGSSTAGFIKKFTFSGSTPTLAATVEIMSRPMFPALDGFGNIWVPCYYANKIAVLDLATLTVQQYKPTALHPYEVFRDGEGLRMLITENGNASLLIYGDDDTNARVFLAAGSGPAGVRRVPGGNIYVNMSVSNAIGVVTSGLSYVGAIGVGVHPPKLTWDGVNLWNVEATLPSVLRRTRL